MKVYNFFQAKSSDYFRNYIERGLKGIENEASASSHNILSESGQRNSDNNSAGVGGASDAYAPKLYLDRLKMLRAQAGLDSGIVVHQTTVIFMCGWCSLVSFFRLCCKF